MNEIVTMTQQLNVNDKDPIFIDSIIQYTILILSYLMIMRQYWIKRKYIRFCISNINWRLLFVFSFAGGNLILLLLGLSSVIEYKPISWIQLIIDEIKIILLFIIIRLTEKRYDDVRDIKSKPYKSDKLIKKIIPNSSLF